MKDVSKPAIITEQGDLGLGFDPLNEQDQQALEEATEENKPE